MIQVAGILAAEDFYEPALGLVYAAMMDLYTRNRPIDLLTVREVLDDQKKLESM
jgi:replicative DNA helicase